MTTTSDHPPVAAQLVFTKPFLAKLKGLLSHTWNAVFKFLAESNHEPVIRQVQGKNGESFWEIYEPHSGKTFYCMDDYEVMEWLDQRHWRQ